MIRNQRGYDNIKENDYHDTVINNQLNSAIIVTLLITHFIDESYYHDLSLKHRVFDIHYRITEACYGSNAI